jgi:hypothetical protein
MTDAKLEGSEPSHTQNDPADVEAQAASESLQGRRAAFGVDKEASQRPA